MQGACIGGGVTIQCVFIIISTCDEVSKCKFMETAVTLMPHGHFKFVITLLQCI